MTQEEKRLLLIDLSGRLPYGVRVKELEPIKELELYLTSIYHDTVQVETMTGGIMACSVEAIKPYLRPLSSMTEEEKREVRELGVCDDGAFHNDVYDVGTSMEEAFTAISWFLERHFDINYLIQRGLALEAPEGMYKND